MKAYIDNRLLSGNLLGAKSEQLQALFSWPAFLEYIGLHSLFEKFPLFNEQNKLFVLITSQAVLSAEKELLFEAYDQVFADCLTQVKALPVIDQGYLLDQIQEKKQSLTSKIWMIPLEGIERSLKEHPYDTLHDLILYLAWDRVCVFFAHVFDTVSNDITMKRGLEVFKECLLESFLHIAKQGKTRLGFFRLVEALYAYQMREESLPSYSEDEWQILCQSSQALMPREKLIDVPYVDGAVIELPHNGDRKVVKVMTIDSAEKVKAAHSLAHYMIEKLQSEIPEWRYTLCHLEIACMTDLESPVTTLKL